MWSWINEAKRKGITGAATSVFHCIIQPFTPLTISPTLNKTSATVWQRLALAFYQKIHILNRFFFSFLQEESFQMQIIFLQAVVGTNSSHDGVSCALPTEMMPLQLLTLFLPSSASKCSDEKMRSCLREKAESKASGTLRAQPWARLRDDGSWSSMEGRHIKARYHSPIKHR